MDWTWFAIKPSNYVSSLCYSVLKVEPYSRCPVGCMYCYARWYWGHTAGPQPEHVRAFEALAHKLGRAPLPKPFFRVSTLADPLQPLEARHRLTLRVMKAALRYGVPIIINTKTALIAEEPWLGLASRLAEEGLILVQVSAAFIDETAKVLEPGAPSTTTRLEVIEVLKQHGVPVVARIQPLMPGLEDEHIAVAADALRAGAEGIIGESLREEREGWGRIYRVIGEEPPSELVPYDVSGEGKLLHPTLKWRRSMHEKLKAVAEAFGRPYSTCKEWVTPRSDGRDCCLTWLALRGRALRPTLHEYAAWLAEGGGGGWEGFIRWCTARLGPKRYVCGEALERYPRPVARALRYHERKLSRVVGDEALLRRLGLGGEEGGEGVDEPR